MKKTILILLFALNAKTYAQDNAWTRKTDFSADARSGAVSFSIGSKGYMGTGEQGLGARKDFWEYDPASDTWTQKADFAGNARYGAASFSIGNKGYTGIGADFNNGGAFNDFWEYDPQTNKWTKKANFGGVARYAAVGFSIGSKGYVGTGSTLLNNTDLKNDFWEYNPATDTWTKKSDFSGPARVWATGFSIGNKGYLGTGSEGSWNTIKNDFWEYDPITNLWTQKAKIDSVGMYKAVGFNVGKKGYIGAGTGTGLASDGMTTVEKARKEFFEYDPATNSWTRQPNFKGIARSGSVGFSIGNRGYLGIGDTLKDFWEFCVPVYNELTITACKDYTLNNKTYTSSGLYKQVLKSAMGCDSILTIYLSVNIGIMQKGNALIATDSTAGANYQWLDCNNGNIPISGETKQTFLPKTKGSYAVIVTNNSCSDTSDCFSQWIQKKDFSGTARGYAVGFSIGNKGYLGTGIDENGLTNDFWEYSPITDSWAQKADFGGSRRYSATGFCLNNKGYIGTGTDGMNSFNDFWEYDPILNTWIKKADFPGTPRHSVVSFSIADKGYLGTGTSKERPYERDFWQYDPKTNIWTRKTDFGGSEAFRITGNGPVGLTIGSKGYVALTVSTDPDLAGNVAALGFVENNIYNFWEYDSATDTWTKKTNFPGYPSYATGFTLGNRAYIGSADQTDFWEYDPFVDAWKRIDSCSSVPRYSAVSFSIGKTGYVVAGMKRKEEFLRSSDNKVSGIQYAPQKEAYLFYQDMWAYSTFNKSITTSLTKPVNFDEINVFPNPTSGQLTITLKNKNTINIKLINLTGQVIMEKSNLAEENFTVDISGQASGIYFLEINNNGNVSRVKVIKE